MVNASPPREGRDGEGLEHRTAQVVQTLNDNPGFVYSVAFHRGGKHLATAARTGR